MNLPKNLQCSQPDNPLDSQRVNPQRNRHINQPVNHLDLPRNLLVRLVFNQQSSHSYYLLDNLLLSHPLHLVSLLDSQPVNPPTRPVSHQRCLPLNRLCSLAVRLANHLSNQQVIQLTSHFIYRRHSLPTSQSTHLLCSPQAILQDQLADLLVNPQSNRNVDQANNHSIAHQINQQSYQVSNQVSNHSAIHHLSLPRFPIAPPEHFIFCIPQDFNVLAALPATILSLSPLLARLVHLDSIPVPLVALHVPAALKINTLLIVAPCNAVAVLQAMSTAALAVSPLTIASAPS